MPTTNSQEIFIRGLESGDPPPGFYRRYQWGLRGVCASHTQRNSDIAAHGNGNVRLRQGVLSLQVYVDRFTQLISELWARQHIEEYFRKLWADDTYVVGVVLAEFGEDMAIGGQVGGVQERLQQGLELEEAFLKVSVVLLAMTSRWYDLVAHTMHRPMQRSGCWKPRASS